MYLVFNILFVTSVLNVLICRLRKRQNDSFTILPPLHHIFNSPVCEAFLVSHIQWSCVEFIQIIGNMINFNDPITDYKFTLMTQA